MLRPDVFLTSILEITPKLLNEIGVFAIILDVDNTIRLHNEDVLLKGVLSWVKKMKEAGFVMIIASNNFGKRVQPVANILNLPYVSFSFKPFPFGLKKAVKKIKFSKKNKNNIVIVGDQFFTDVVGGKIQGFKTILVEPLKNETGFFWKVRRKIERLVLHKFL